MRDELTDSTCALAAKIVYVTHDQAGHDVADRVADPALADSLVVLEGPQLAGYPSRRKGWVVFAEVARAC